MFRLLTPLFIASALAGACAVAEDGPAPGDDGERGSIGKADLVGSCETPAGVDFCGGKGTGTCWCDEACLDYGDCCSDVGEVCGIGDDGGDDVADDAGDDGDVCGEVVCALFCENGFVTDDNGCEICECQGQFCGGIGAIQCPENEICVLQGNFPDAGGTCEPAPFCGGFAGIPCPEGLECFDVPGDGCDPPEGADCGGICLPPIDPPPPPPPSCEGNCGGSAGECWCDDLCTGYGDCCKDYEDVCVDDEPEGIECGDEICGPGHTCVTHVTQLGFQHACQPVPEACEDDVGDCACMGADVCTGVFDSCSDNPDGGLFCSCPVC